MIRTQVAIVGAGPAGLLLGALLGRAGIDNIIVERASPEHVLSRIRAGVLEQGTVDLLDAVGCGARLHADGLIHEGIDIAFGDTLHRVDLKQHSGGRVVTVYGQTEVTRDLMEARAASGQRTIYEASDVTLHDVERSPAVSFRHDGATQRIACDFIAGCDGAHGVCRGMIPADKIAIYERFYPFAWLGILAEAPPAFTELIYTHHEAGFALYSMRSPTLSRLYLQCDPGDGLEQWPDARIWRELHRRSATADGRCRLAEGPILQRGLTPMHSVVAEPMQAGRLFLAGDAAHIVPPTGAKGMNLALADVHYLSEALVAYYRTGSIRALDAYSARCLRRVWKVQRFSWWMTALLHRHPDATPFDRRRQLAELDYLTGSEAAMKSLAENYVGLPLD